MTNINIIKTTKFKKNIITINFRRKTFKEEITKINMLMYILMMSSKKYKTSRELAIETKNLYNLNKECFATLSGNCIIISFNFHFLSEKYTEIGNTQKIVDFIKEVIFDPNVSNNEFNQECFDIAKQEVIDDIKTAGENKGIYSRKKMYQAMDPNNPFALDCVGNMDDLDKITPKNLYEFYLESIIASPYEIFALGGLNENHFINWPVCPKKFKSPHVYKFPCRENVQTIVEKSDVNQSKLVIGYNMDNVTKSEVLYALEIYSYILGISPTSKLFTKVREEESMCYSISVTSRYMASSFILQAGIDATNFDKAVTLIKKQFLEMEQGIFTEQDINNAKINIKTTYQEMKENPFSLLNFMESIKYLHYDSLRTRLKKIDEVTKEDIMNVAKKIKINTIFLLEGNQK